MSAKTKDEETTEAPVEETTKDDPTKSEAKDDRLVGATLEEAMALQQEAALKEAAKVTDEDQPEF